MNQIIEEGRKAALNGLMAVSCPYFKNKEKMDLWLNGWFEVKFN
jgi:ribosome modulation factor